MSLMENVRDAQREVNEMNSRLLKFADPDIRSTLELVARRNFHRGLWVGLGVGVVSMSLARLAVWLVVGL